MKKCFLLILCLVSLPGMAIDVLELSRKVEKLGVEQKELYRNLSNELRCPTCTGLSVLQSDAPFSLQIRNSVLEQVAQGKSHEEILTFFTKRYGEWIRRQPPQEGFHMIAWGLPMALLVFAFILILVFYRRRWAHSQHAVEYTPPRSEQDIREHLHQILAKRGVKI